MLIYITEFLTFCQKVNKTKVREEKIEEKN